MTDEWLERRVVASPPPLRERLESAIAKLDARRQLSDALLDVACQVLEDVRVGLDRREAAFGLLLADGLLTLACEASAYDDPETVAKRCREMGPDGALGRMAERWAGRS